MKHTILSNVLVALMFLLGAGAAQAQTVLFDPNNSTQAIGIDNLDVDGTTYHVDFSDKTNPKNVYSPPDYPGVLDFNDLASAEEAMAAVDLALNGAAGGPPLLVGAEATPGEAKYIIGYGTLTTGPADNLLNVTSTYDDQVGWQKNPGQDTTLWTALPPATRVIAKFTGPAAVILQVDVSDPTAVVFTSTNGKAQNTFSNLDSSRGIVLLDFFSGNTGTLDVTLDAGEINVFEDDQYTNRLALETIYVGTAGNLTPTDLNLYKLTGGDMFFVDDTRALTGFAWHDLSALTGLPTVGTVGTLFADSAGNTIGQWEVVPEPSNAALITAALMTLGLVRQASRRRHR